MKVLSLEKVLEAIGGPARLRDAMWRCGQPVPSHQLIYEWRRRDIVPGVWAGAVLWSVLAQRPSVEWLDLLNDR